MNWLKKIFGTNTDKAKNIPDLNNVTIKESSLTKDNSKIQANKKSEPNNGNSIFPNGMLERVSMVIINYEGQKDIDLQQNVVNHLMPLMRNGGGFVCYCNASISPLTNDEPACAMINVSGGYPAVGVSLDSYMSYIASKDSFPSQSPAYGHEYSFNQIGYWVGKQNGTKVHAVLLF